MIKALLLANILLATIWVLATGTITQENFVFGFLISFGILWIITPDRSKNDYFTIVPKLISFTVFVLYQIIKSNIQTFIESLYPKSKLSPAILKVPLDVESDGEITFFSHLLNITPGTLVIDISDDKKALFVHVVHCEDKEAYIRQIKEVFEKRVLELTR
ncbi:Na+/H+ antiporter subunit E [Cecembia calidifontis]|jgi:multicomponent Na+:H+ antiporter subunit E|uniref:Multicomponent Na+:H+ antiporter subunit E n=1 Tax=Cecembia calidifontis TaxID=1187080 RepID=A0A4Q7PBZ6_9BACT|nr:Na+/H+ antiporter subunit E [Cecembia calidifontis]RZS97218.1 multicomponent Na+:H+ antiporter subunit E [Cecembia calidifontis]